MLSKYCLMLECRILSLQGLYKSKAILFTFISFLHGVLIKKVNKDRKEIVCFLLSKYKLDASLFIYLKIGGIGGISYFLNERRKQPLFCALKISWLLPEDIRPSIKAYEATKRLDLPLITH